MKQEQHYSFLESLYLQAPIVKEVFPETQIRVSNGFARIEWPVEGKFHHGAAGLHGSAYFRLLDDAAYFAASSHETTYFLVTASFELQFLRPVSAGLLRAEGRLLEEQAGRLLRAEASLYNEEGRLLAKGSGKFAHSRQTFSHLDSGLKA